MQDNLKIIYGGKLNQVDIATLINSLSSVATIAEEITREIFPEYTVKIKIKPFEKGSFIVDLDFISQLIDSSENLLTKDNLTVIAELISVLGGIFSLRKFLKGKKPKEVKEGEAKTVITNSFGNTISVENKIYHIYHNNQNVDEALSNNFESLNNDSSIENFKIQKGEKETIFEIKKDEFSKVVNQERIDDLLPKERIVKFRTNVHIFKIVFENRYKWEFIYRHEKIKANIKDEQFFKEIDEGKKFSKGDVLEVELEINQLMDDSVKTYINKSYTILKVFRHIPRDEQINMEL